MRACRGFQLYLLGMGDRTLVEVMTQFKMLNMLTGVGEEAEAAQTSSNMRCQGAACCCAARAAYSASPFAQIFCVIPSGQ